MQSVFESYWCAFLALVSKKHIDDHITGNVLTREINEALWGCTRVKWNFKKRALLKDPKLKIV